MNMNMKKKKNIAVINRNQLKEILISMFFLNALYLVVGYFMTC